MQLSKRNITQFQQHILSWFEKNKRNLPWRLTRDPYKIFISEVMLQQTQVERVIPKYKAWLEKFPTLQDLARASSRDVLLLWSGLGYNRRALYLKKTAEILREGSKGTKEPKEPDGIVWPRTEKELMELPGIGKYTARAILCFAFNEQVAVVDTNVRKVILISFFSERVKRVEEPSTSSGKKELDKEIQAIVDQLLPEGKAYEWNQALMDYAAIELRNGPSTPLGVRSKVRFKDSDRYYRGQIVKYVLSRQKTSEEDLQKQFEKSVGNERLRKILKGLRKDALLE